MNSRINSQTKALVLAICVYGGVVSSALAQDPGAEKRAMEVWDTVMSPYCPGRTLSACPSDDARKLRDEVLEMANAGASVESIKDSLRAQFGAAVEGTPAKEGIGLWGWRAPALFVLLGALALYLFVRRNSATLDETERTVSGDDKRAEEIRRRLSEI